jgi:hypothetical protein
MPVDVSQLTKVGVALGSGAYGTASGSFTRGILASAFGGVSPQHTVNRVPSVRGDMSTQKTTKGPIRYPGLAMTFPLDVGNLTSASIGDFLASIFGNESGVDEGAGIYSHQFDIQSATDTPPWLNLWSDKDAVNKQIQGLRVGSLEFSLDGNADDGVIPVTVGGICQTESDLSADQSLVFSDEPLLTPADASTISIGGAVTNFDILTITITRGQVGFKPISNVRTINELISGTEFSMIITAEGLNFATETERDKFKGNNSTSFALTLTDSNSNFLQVTAPVVDYQTFDGPDISDTDILKISCAMIVKDAPGDFYVKLQNEYSNKYTDGSAIT